jgi:hypothetical protein
MKDTIKNAFGRFTELGLLDASTYQNEDGSQVTYLSAPIERKAMIEELFNKFIANRSDATELLFQVWGEAANKAVENANVAHMTSKL